MGSLTSKSWSRDQIVVTLRLYQDLRDQRRSDRAAAIAYLSKLLDTSSESIESLLADIAGGDPRAGAASGNVRAELLDLCATLGADRLATRRAAEEIEDRIWKDQRSAGMDFETWKAEVLRIWGREGRGRCRQPPKGKAQEAFDAGVSPWNYFQSEIAMRSGTVDDIPILGEDD